MATITKEQVKEYIKNATVLELSELIKELEDELGVTAQAAVAMAPVAAAGGEEKEQEKTEFDVVLTAAGDQKIKVIKVVKDLLGLGLKEAKALVDAAPKPIKTGVSKEEAEQIKEKITEVGGLVDIK